MEELAEKFEDILKAIQKFGDCFDTRYYLQNFNEANDMVLKLHHAIDEAVATKGHIKEFGLI